MFLFKKIMLLHLYRETSVNFTSQIKNHCKLSLKEHLRFPWVQDLKANITVPELTQEIFGKELSVIVDVCEFVVLSIVSC